MKIKFGSMPQSVYDWMFVCNKCKLRPEFMSEFRLKLQLDYINYEMYSINDLLRTEGILFPLPRLRYLSPKELLLLFNYRKITANPKGGVKLQILGYASYTNGAHPLYSVGQLANKNEPFEKHKPFLLNGSLGAYTIQG